MSYVASVQVLLCVLYFILKEGVSKMWFRGLQICLKLASIKVDRRMQNEGIHCWVLFNIDKSGEKILLLYENDQICYIDSCMLQFCLIQAIFIIHICHSLAPVGLHNVVLIP